MAIVLLIKRIYRVVFRVNDKFELSDITCP
jgi:hypothetical protein